MSNLPLQPLVWTDTLTTTTIFRTYKVRLDVKGRFSVYYESSTGKPATGFISVDDAKHWAEFTHYASEMQPYVKPSPTWIDASKQLPSHHQDVIVYRYNDNDGGNIEHSLYLEGEVMVGFGNVADEEGFFDDVYYWQPIETKSLYEAMHMQLQISEATND